MKDVKIKSALAVSRAGDSLIGAHVTLRYDAPKGGCGGGRRKRILVAAGTEWCPHCGSQVRVCKVQPPISET